MRGLIKGKAFSYFYNSVERESGFLGVQRALLTWKTALVEEGQTLLSPVKSATT